MPVLTVPKNLRHKLGDDESDELVLLLNEANNELKTDIIELVEERFAAKLTQAISGLRTEFKEDNASLRSELKQDMANLRAELKEDNASLRAEIKENLARLEVKIAAAQANLIKWMFIFWSGQILVILAILLAFFKK